MLLLTHGLLDGLADGQHMFNQWELWAFLLGCLALVVVVRFILQGVLWLFLGVNLREQLVIRDNPAWGVLDGGLIFVLFLLLVAVVV